jgi:plastocyanin
MSERPTREGLLLPILIPVGCLVLIGLVLYGFSRVLLATSAAAATGVALVVAVAIMTTASVIASRRRQPNGVLFSLFGIVAGVAMLAGGVAILAFAPAEGGEGFVATLAAPPNAAVDGFAPDKLSVPAGEPVSLEFDNQDPGIQHNVVVFDGQDDQAPTLAEATIITGVANETVALEPLAPGTYFFHCAVHPSTMTGTIEASEGGGGPPGGEGGLVVVASGLAFDTAEIDLPADQPSQITLDNRDPAVVHNISIFPDESSLDAPMFDGADVTGPDQATYEVPAFPAGTYYFHCDTHPNMSGSVVVSAGEGGEGGGGGGEPPPPTGATGPSG